ncbi:hypothetical protein ABTH94_22795, partial [Acinetobacter baumannii]
LRTHKSATQQEFNSYSASLLHYFLKQILLLFKLRIAWAVALVVQNRVAVKVMADAVQVLATD